MMQAAYIDPASQQDGLRSVRNFVSLLSGAVNDQTYAETDYYAMSYPGQFAVQGPNGVAVEGRPQLIGHTQASATAAAANGGTPSMLLIGGALLVAYLVFK